MQSFSIFRELLHYVASPLSFLRLTKAHLVQMTGKSRLQLFAIDQTFQENEGPHWELYALRGKVLVKNQKWRRRQPWVRRDIFGT